MTWASDWKRSHCLRHINSHILLFRQYRKCSKDVSPAFDIFPTFSILSEQKTLRVNMTSASFWAPVAWATAWCRRYSSRGVDPGVGLLHVCPHSVTWWLVCLSLSSTGPDWTPRWCRTSRKSWTFRKFGDDMHLFVSIINLHIISAWRYFHCLCVLILNEQYGTYHLTKWCSYRSVTHKCFHQIKLREVSPPRWPLCTAILFLPITPNRNNKHTF